MTMGFDEFITSIIDGVLALVLGALEAQYAAIFNLIDLLVQLTM